MLFRSVRLANNKVKLYQLFDFYKIRFDIIYSTSGWDHRCQCPFPDHRDSSPSFNYNPEVDRFNCFGCGRSGQSVQFKAGMEKISSRTAAEALIEMYGINYDICDIDDCEEKNSNIDKILLDFSVCARNSGKDYALIEKITWNLDLFVQKHIEDHSLNEEQLLARVEILKRKLI